MRMAEIAAVGLQLGKRIAKSTGGFWGVEVVYPDKPGLSEPQFVVLEPEPNNWIVDLLHKTMVSVHLLHSSELMYFSES